MFNTSPEMSREPVYNVELAQADKEKFLKLILIDQPYSEVISFMDDQLRINFRAMSNQENTDVVNQIVQDNKDGLAADNDSYLVTVQAYRLFMCLVDVNGKPVEKTEDPSKAGYIRRQTAELLAWPTAKLAIYIEAFLLFEAKVMKLMTSVQQKDFWKASASNV